MTFSPPVKSVVTVGERREKGLSACLSDARFHHQIIFFCVTTMGQEWGYLTKLTSLIEGGGATLIPDPNWVLGPLLAG